MKRSAILVLAIIVGTATMMSQWRGDLNKNGHHSIGDLTLLIDYMMGNTAGIDRALADVNGDGEVNSDDVTRLVEILLGEAEPLEYTPGTEGDEYDCLTISYDAGQATYTMPSAWAPYVTVSTDGAHVTVTNTNEEEEYTLVLQGKTEDGSLTYNGSFKTTLVLNGLQMTSLRGGAIDVECGKRIALELADGTENQLADAAKGEQKACLYCKGHLEVSKSGRLTIQGNARHAISTKEYLLLKKTMGGITITGAPSDGIHAGQYFEMNGGEVTIRGTKGDGIQAEATSNTTDEENGQLRIDGGTLDITTTANDVAALKSDSLMTITDGQLTLACSGAGSKGMKSKTDIQVDGGTLNITTSGGLYDSSSEPDDEETDKEEDSEEQKSYKVYVAKPTQSSNNWTGMYIYDNKTNARVATLTSTVNVGSGMNAKAFYVYDFKQPTTGTYYFKSDDYTSRSGNRTTYAIRSATFSGPTSGSDVFYQLGSYTTSGSTRTFALQNVTSTYGGGTITPGGGTTSGADLSSTHAIKGDLGVSINGGTLTLSIKGTAGKGISSDKDVTVNGGTLNITNSGAGQLATGTETYTAKGIGADENVRIAGGTVTISMSGTGGKGIKADKNIYIGDQNTKQGPTLSVSTTGATLATGSSGSGGGFGGGGMGGEVKGSDAKAIKCMGSYYQYGGDIFVSTTQSGAEGIESKTSSTTSMNFAGGNIYLMTADDCINSSGQINFTGANVISISSSNDAIDSNYQRVVGAITVTGGTVFTFSQRGGAEMGVDCDGMNYVKVTGGILVAGGGSQGSASSTMGSGSTHYKCWSASLSYKANTYYSIVCGGKNIVTWKMPAAVTSSYNVLASNLFTSNTTHTIYSNTTAPTSGTAYGFHTVAGGSTTPMVWTGSNVTSGTQLTTFSPN